MLNDLDYIYVYDSLYCDICSLWSLFTNFLEIDVQTLPRPFNSLHCTGGCSRGGRESSVQHQD